MTDLLKQLLFMYNLTIRLLVVPKLGGVDRHVFIPLLAREHNNVVT